MLYVVATPIGNLKDISLRAIEVLNNCEYILCEDTRTSMTLLNHYDIKKKLVSYHKFNEASKCESVANDIQQGKDIALISDAGMPGISDPGAVIIRYLIKQNLPYTVIPGASALINAFVLSGYDAPFTFVGFLPEKSKEKKELFSKLKSSSFPMIFYVSPHSIHDFFGVLSQELGKRDVCVVRELTKKFEEVTFTSTTDGYNGVVKGEFVCIVKGLEVEQNELTEDEIMDKLNDLIAKGKTNKEAVAIVSDMYGLKKNKVYDISIKHK